MRAEFFGMNLKAISVSLLVKSSKVFGTVIYQVLQT